MTFLGFALIFVSVAMSALGQTCFKAGVTRVSFADGAGVLGKAAALLFSPWVLGGLAFYGIGTVLWLFALRRVDLSLAYPFVSMSFVMVVGAGVVFLGEALTLPKLLGLCLIIAGLCVMALDGVR